MRALWFRHRAALARLCRLLLLALPALLLGGAGVRAEAVCRTVSGSYVEQTVSGADCLSPVGVCLEATYSGDVRGDSTTVVSTLVPTADTPTTAVLLFTADTTLHARVSGRSGDLIIKNAGAFHTAGAGDIVDVQSIVGATGQLAGTTGALRASGTFSLTSGSGRSIYSGTICLP